MMKHGEFSTLTTPMAADRRAAFPPSLQKQKPAFLMGHRCFLLGFFFNLHIHILFWMLQSGQEKSKKSFAHRHLLQFYLIKEPFRGFSSDIIIKDEIVIF